MEPKVAIIMGSKSDLPTMRKAVEMLNELDITSYTVNIYSAHRTPDELAEFVAKVDKDESYKVIIAGAGMSAALAAASIIALSDSSVAERLCYFRKEQKEKVLEANEEICCEI